MAPAAMHPFVALVPCGEEDEDDERMHGRGSRSIDLSCSYMHVRLAWSSIFVATLASCACCAIELTSENMIP